MFLTPPQVFDLTGYKRGADQRRWLEARGFVENVDYYVDKNGKPILPAATFGQTAHPGQAPPAAPLQTGERVLVRHKHAA
jgi:hypothetical protein